MGKHHNTRVLLNDEHTPSSLFLKKSPKYNLYCLLSLYIDTMKLFKIILF